MLSLGLLSGALGNGTISGGTNNYNTNNNTKKSQYLDAAVKLGDTCYHMYSNQPLGLSPEFVTFSMTTGEMMAGNYNNNGGGGGGGGTAYLQRPEAIESFWYLWRLTGDWKYRIWGLEIFKSIEKHCKVESGGYSGIKNVRGSGGGRKRRRKEEEEEREDGEVVMVEKDDTQQSFFIAETLKYLWLLFGGGDDEGWDWENGWVLNTEAHPLRVEV
jgi:mannosyl-oligosaccharide alpha-1,2-mannosidase